LNNSSIRQSFVYTPGRRADALLFLLFISGYAALIGWFKYVDVYHNHFSDTGGLLLLNNLFRVLFLFYLFWMIQAAGAALLRLFGECNPDTLGTPNYLALTFFAGAGLWHVALLALGYLNLLNVAVMVILTAPVVALSFREVRLVGPRLHIVSGRLFGKGGFLFKVAAASLAVIWCALLLVKALYPGGSFIDYSLYFQYYEAVLEHGGVWPNEFWWYYFYAKGAGLFFLAMLLTDPLAPQLVTFCFISVAGLAIFNLIRRLAPDTAWPMVGLLLFLLLFIHPSGWGEFRQLHEFNTALVIAILWMIVVALGERGSAERIWLVAAASAIAAAIVLSTYIGVFLGAVLGVLALSYCGLREFRRGAICFAFATLAGALVGGIFAVNFATTGLLNGWDPSLLYFWKFTGVEKLHRLDALPIVLSVHRRIVQAAAGNVHLSSFKFLIQSLRLTLLWPLIFGGLLVAAISAYQRFAARGFSKRPISDIALVLIAATVVFVAVTVTLGRGQPPSFYRFSSFMLPVTIVAGIALCTLSLRQVPQPPIAVLVRHSGTAIVVLMLCAVMIAAKTRLDRNIGMVGGNALAYAAGLTSTDVAYGQQSTDGPTFRGGAIYPGARGAYAIVGPHTPILSMNAFTFCMLPNCKMMSFNSTRMPGWDRVMWGTPEEARTALRAAGLNYFLISRELPITDPLVLSPLFSPDSIARNLAMRWTDGTTTLLTWPGADATTPDDTWLGEYRQMVTQAPGPRRLSIAEMKIIFEQLDATPHPWRSFDLPWQRK
jgi:hypothetical protein